MCADSSKTTKEIKNSNRPYLLLCICKASAGGHPQFADSCTKIKTVQEVSELRQARNRISPARALSAAFFCFSTAFGGILLRSHSPGCRYKIKGLLPRHARSLCYEPASASFTTLETQVRCKP